MSTSPPTFRPRSAIGIDLAEGSITLVQVARGQAPAACTVLAEDVPALSADVQQRLARLAEQGAVTAAALPVHASFLRRLTAPFPSVAKAQRVFPSLLDIQLPFPLETCVCDFLAPARTADGQVTTLAVAARREDIAQTLARCRAAHLDPALLDQESLAVWTQSLLDLPLANEGWRGVAYLGHDRTSFLLGRGAELRTASGVRLGVRDFDDPARGAEALRHLASRINPWLRAQVPAATTADLQWAWTGPGAAAEARVATVRAVVSLPEGAQTFVHKEPGTFLARALARRAVEGGPQVCNLRRGEQEHPHYTAALQRQRRRCVAGALAASLLVCAVDAGWLGYLQYRRDGLQRAVQALAGELAGSDRLPRGQEVLTAERALQERAPQYAPFRDAFLPSVSGVLASLLQTAASHHMTLETVSVRPQAIVCNGTAADWEQAEAIQAELAQGGWKAELERHDAGADERVHFTVKAAR